MNNSAKGDSDIQDGDSRTSGQRITALNVKIKRLEEQVESLATSLSEMTEQRDNAIIEASRAISALRSIRDSAYTTVKEITENDDSASRRYALEHDLALIIAKREHDCPSK